MKIIFKLGRSVFMSYNTKQKDLILEIVEKQKHDFTIKDIYDSLNGSVGLTTIYRLIDKLIEEGLVNKYIDKNKTYYQYLSKCEEENHFFLRCNKCGSLVHIDCDCIQDLSNHILKEHKFKPDKEHIIINGMCDKCLKK